MIIIAYFNYSVIKGCLFSYVTVPATIVDMPSEVTAVENSNVVIKCNAIGTPQPTIRWLRNDKIVESDGEKYTIMANNSLVILNMKEQDSGDYICKASNDIGRPAIRTVNLVFQGHCNYVFLVCLICLYIYIFIMYLLFLVCHIQK